MADSELMSLDELDKVSGGSYDEILKDLRLFGAIGLITKKQVPAKVDSRNFVEMNRLAFEIWQKIGVNVRGRENADNRYNLPADGAQYGNTRQGALDYAIYQSGRGDLDISAYL